MYPKFRGRTCIRKELSFDWSSVWLLALVACAVEWWASHRILDEGSPVSSIMSVPGGISASGRLMDYWEIQRGFFDDFPFYCTGRDAGGEIAGDLSVVGDKRFLQYLLASRQTTPLWRPLAKYAGVEGDSYPRRKGGFFCTPVISGYHSPLQAESVGPGPQRERRGWRKASI